MHKYAAFFNGKATTIMAASRVDAYAKAIKHFKPAKNKRHMISLVLEVSDMMVGVCSTCGGMYDRCKHIRSLVRRPISRRHILNIRAHYALEVKFGDEGPNAALWAQRAQQALDEHHGVYQGDKVDDEL